MSLQTVYNRNNMKGREIMHKEIEIEFKNLLTKEEFHQLLAHFHIQQTDFHTQTNYYYDTPNNYFKDKKIGFRMRVLANRNELTIKVPEQQHMMTETTQYISTAERDAILNTLSFPNVPFLEQIKDEGDLSCIGNMQTNRAQINFKDGILFFDHSLYSQTEDFEIEYESKDIENGERTFLHLLKTHQIPVRHTDKKIARLMKYIQSLKG